MVFEDTKNRKIGLKMFYWVQKRAQEDSLLCKFFNLPMVQPLSYLLDEWKFCSVINLENWDKILIWLAFLSVTIRLFVKNILTTRAPSGSMNTFEQSILLIVKERKFPIQKVSLIMFLEALQVYTKARFSNTYIRLRLLKLSLIFGLREPRKSEGDKYFFFKKFNLFFLIYVYTLL